MAGSRSRTIPLVFGDSFQNYCPRFNSLVHCQWAPLQSLTTRILDFNISQLNQRSLRTRPWTWASENQKQFLGTIQRILFRKVDIRSWILFKFFIFKHLTSGLWVLVFFLGFSHFIAICCELLRLMRDLLYSLSLSIGFSSWDFGLFLRIMHKISLFRGALAVDLWPRPGPQPSKKKRLARL